VCELNASVIIDLYEYNAYEKVQFVKDFLDALIDMPKELYGHRLVVVSETHQFAPQQAKSESLGSVTNLATRGRKRGLCAVFDTQRPSKLHKDAAAECLNKMGGRMGLDIDMKRAYEDFGFTTKAQYYSIRELKTGEFFAFGPAIIVNGKPSNQIVTLPPCKVQTTPPTLEQKTGARSTKDKATPTDKVKNILTKLADLPHQAEEELKTKQDFEKRIRELKAQLRQQKPWKFVEKTKVEKVFDEKEYERRIKEYSIKLNKEIVVRTKENIRKRQEALRKLESEMSGHTQAIDATTKKFSQVVIFDEISEIYPFKTSVKELRPLSPKREVVDFKTSSKTFESVSPMHTKIRHNISEFESNGKLPSAALKMLQAAATRHPEYITRIEIGILSGYSSGGSHFSNMLSLLRSQGFIGEVPNGFVVSDGGMEAAGDYASLSTDPDSLISLWSNNLAGAAAKMLQVLYQEPNLSRTELGDKSGYASTGSHFSNMLSSLRSNRLIVEEGGKIRLHEVFSR
jgi:hypothetical protein